ncbi:hypothetical protein OpiT1DRAFT_05982 [Opitutaceae bacterium TAV1]|nr:hypothetical protein OpiT1DRAFT_05982 [Opitutaceae bacterium TAV1]
MSPSRKNYLVGFFLLTTFAGAGVAVSQYFQIQDLRSQAQVNVTQVAAIDKTAAKAYLDHAATAAPAADVVQEEDQPVSPDAVGEGTEERGFRRGPGNFGARMTELMKDPEFAEAMRLRQRADLDRRYAGLFKELNLPADKLNALKDLMIERQNAAMDVFATAQSQGLNPRENREELRQLVQSTQSEVDASIKAALGDAAYSQYENYNATQPQRGTVNRISESLSYSNAPLTSSQAQQLVTIMAQNNTREITDQVITQAQGVLTSGQVAALKQYQAEQQAREVVNQKMREARQQQQRQSRQARN